MDDEADEFVEVAVAAGTGLSWDIPRKEGGKDESSLLTMSWKRGGFALRLISLVWRRFS